MIQLRNFAIFLCSEPVRTYFIPVIALLSLCFKVHNYYFVHVVSVYKHRLFVSVYLLLHNYYNLKFPIMDSKSDAILSPINDLKTTQNKLDAANGRGVCIRAGRVLGGASVTLPALQNWCHQLRRTLLQRVKPSLSDR